MARRRYSSLAEFWPYYVTQHRKRLTRQLHFIGTHNLIFWLVYAARKRSFKYTVFAVVTSYLFAWIGHFLVEGNIPATFDYPVLSALAEMRMYGEIWRGTMDNEVAQFAGELEELEIRL